jgi:23S rRNA pseudouridine1911/1915/1917 synthase
MKKNSTNKHKHQKDTFLPDIMYEDNHILVINKPAGILSQGDKTGDRSVLDMYKSYLKDKYNKPGNVFLGLIHRLDRPVSGVLVLAKTGKALSRLNSQFKKQETEKLYYALVKNMPPQSDDKLEHYLKKNKKQNKSYVCDASDKTAKKAMLEYKTVGSSDNYHLLQIRLLTGRHHQIRCQLAYIGCPIKGDLKYGFPRSNSDGGISLHAGKLVFLHPVRKNKMTFTADFPDDVVWPLFRDCI